MVYNEFMTTILGIKLPNRENTSLEFQKILSDFGCIIKTRLGLHSLQDGLCTPYGIILLEITDDKKLLEFEAALLKINQIEIQSMQF